MKCIQYSLVFTMLAAAVVPNEATFPKSWFKKDHNVVVVAPIKVEPIYVEPVPVEPIHLQPVPIKPIDVGLLEATKQPIKALWDRVKSTASHVQTAALYPLKKLIPKKKVVTLPVPIPIPEFKVWPSLGFTHYKKVNYYPIQSGPVFTHPLEHHEQKYIEEHVPEHVPFTYEENVQSHYKEPIDHIPFKYEEHEPSHHVDFSPRNQADHAVPLKLDDHVTSYDADHIQSQKSNDFISFKHEDHTDFLQRFPAVHDTYGPPQWAEQPKFAQIQN